MGELSHELGRDEVQPYFIWDVRVTVGELKALLRHPDAKTRALWTARVMREARYQDVWRFLTLSEVVAQFPQIEPHLGRARPLWNFLLAGWRDDGLLPA